MADPESYTQTYVYRDYFSGEHRPYQAMLHDDEDTKVDKHAMIFDMCRYLGIQDGDEFEITIRKTGNRPFNTRWQLVAPNIYRPVSITEVSG